MLCNLFLYDLSTLPAFAVAVIAMFAIVLFRYMLVAGFFHLYFYVWRKDIWQAHKINAKPYRQGQFRTEIMWSAITSLIFALAGSGMVVCWQLGYTQIYYALTWQDVWYMPLSLAVAMLLHETYYYWLHRLMHHPRLYRYLHKVHHDSLIASPWTAFSFHPSEAILEALALPIIVCFLPLHYGVIVFHLTLMTLSSVVNHLDIEVYPAWAGKHWFWKWWIGATHHALHHKQFKYNYGLYFTFWDTFMQTESPQYEEIFQEKAVGKAQP